MVECAGVYMTVIGATGWEDWIELRWYVVAERFPAELEQWHGGCRDFARISNI